MLIEFTKASGMHTLAWRPVLKDAKGVRLTGKDLPEMYHASTLSLTLLPGINEVKEKDWDGAKEALPSLRADITEGLFLERGSLEGELPDAGTMCSIVRNCVVDELLKKIRRLDDREPVQNALEKQFAKLETYSARRKAAKDAVAGQAEAV